MERKRVSRELQRDRPNIRALPRFCPSINKQLCHERKIIPDWTTPANQKSNSGHDALGRHQSRPSRGVSAETALPGRRSRVPVRESDECCASKHHDRFRRDRSHKRIVPSHGHGHAPACRRSGQGVRRLTHERLERKISRKWRRRIFGRKRQQLARAGGSRLRNGRNRHRP
jgi:hypothetical protein